jgi:uncharacterized protein
MLNLKPPRKFMHFFAAVLSMSIISAASAPSDYLQWQQTRLKNLTAEKGWLTLVGLHWMEVGSFSIGSGKDQQIQLAAGPALLGQIERSSQGVITLRPSADILVDGKANTARSVELKTDKDGATPTEISAGSISFFVIDRSGKLGLRIKDSNAKTRTGFNGLAYFKYQPKSKITARFEAYAKPQTIEIATIIGTIEPTPNPGRAVFNYAGKRYQFELLAGTDANHYFTIFGDKTNGKETYGMARFLAGEIDHEKKTVVLDFNTAYNPPCAFTEYATCPMPPASNRIAAKVRAGEKKPTMP